MLLAQGGLKMTHNEKELIKLIRENDNPEQALKIALDLLINGFLEKREEPQDTSSARPRVSA